MTVSRLPLAAPDFGEFGARQGVERIDTHLSTVFRTATDVYKLKKPLRFGRQDLTTLEARRANCEAEVRLNRRLAPHVYVGCVPLCRSEAGLSQVGGPGEPVDWLVHMRRLPDTLFLDRAMRTRTVPVDRLRRAAWLLGHFHRTTPPSTLPADRYLAGFALRFVEIGEHLAAVGLGAAYAGALQGSLARWLDRLADRLSDRVRSGCVVEGHGDLRPEHVCLLPEPVFIDCLEFDPGLRTLDRLDDVAFLALECELQDGQAVASTFVANWRQAVRDEAPPELIRFYQAFRACCRADVAALGLKEPGEVSQSAALREKALRYLDAAEARIPG